MVSLLWNTRFTVSEIAYKNNSKFAIYNIVVFHFILLYFSLIYVRMKWKKQLHSTWKKNIENLDLKHKLINSEEWSREEWCGPYLNNWEYAVTWHLPKKTSWSGYRLGGNHFTQRLRLLMLLGIHCGENRFPKCHSSSFLL